MFYAHKGNATDNGVTILPNGEPERNFYAFATKAERQAFQDKVWQESGRQQNVIFCTAKFAKETLGTSKPYVCSGGYYANRVFRSYEQYEEAVSYEQYLTEE